MTEAMIRVIPHRNLRYRVDRQNTGTWYVYKWYRFAWRAKKVARFREDLGYYKYRVVDTRPKGKN